MTRLALTVLLFGACAGTCPRGTQRDDARRDRIGARLAIDHEARSLDATAASICFAPGRGRGVASGERIFLDGNAPIDELAVELAHLLVHVRDRLGNGCARGLTVAEQSEAHASALEARLRRAYTLPAAPSSDTVLNDYRRRCASRQW